MPSHKISMAIKLYVLAVKMPFRSIVFHENLPPNPPMTAAKLCFTIFFVTFMCVGLSRFTR